MLDRSMFLSLNFYKKEPFHGITLSATDDYS